MAAHSLPSSPAAGWALLIFRCCSALVFYTGAHFPSAAGVLCSQLCLIVRASRGPGSDGSLIYTTLVHNELGLSRSPNTMRPGQVQQLYKPPSSPQGYWDAGGSPQAFCNPHPPLPPTHRRTHMIASTLSLCLMPDGFSRTGREKHSNRRSTLIYYHYCLQS